MDQVRHDREAGLNTSAFISGYPGSPLAGVDSELARQRALLAELGIVHRPAVNEELAMTALMGSQQVGDWPARRLDGVSGWWYGKAPGLERALGALHHANTAGTNATGERCCSSATIRRRRARRCPVARGVYWPIWPCRC